MNSKILILVLISLMNFHYGSSQILACGYRTHGTYSYVCDLLLYNPTGSYNFSRISGTHLAGKTDEDVRYIGRTSDSKSTNVPSIICDTFKNTIYIALDIVGIEYIDENTFKNCKKIQVVNLNSNKIAKIDEKAFRENLDLQELHLYNSRLTTLPENIFANQHKLTTLNLRNNQIVDLPKNIFRTLRQVQTMYLENNKLKVIHAFGFSSNLTTAHLQDNQIEAFDQNFIDDTGVQILDMTNNLCANVSIKDTSPSRLQMRMLMVKCFDNYLNLEPGTTTTSATISSSTTELTLPPECNDGNLDERVCRLEGSIQEKFYNQDKINNEFHDDLTNQSQLIAAMQDKINELENRPCACQ